MCEPPKKRPRLESNVRSVSDNVLRLKEWICQFLNVPEILSETLHPDLNFLKDEEQKSIWKLCDENTPSRRLSSRVLSFLQVRETSEKDEAARKFVACVVKASEHRGHLELAKIFQAKLGSDEMERIQHIIDEVCESPIPSPYVTPQHSPAPERPMKLITLQGQVVELDFLNAERDLWFAFSTGNYDKVQCLVTCVQEKREFNVDCKIIALWFQSLVLMHRDHRYEDAIKMLRRAKCLTKESDNEIILKGRIRQRMAQISLMQNEKIYATKLFEKAKEDLQFVGRGYDKTNMFCREAKVLSATYANVTEPQKRKDIEKVYEQALCTLEKDDPYFLASFPSVTLSKAAFHLHFAFGSKALEDSEPPAVSNEDIRKARGTLKDFIEEEHILIDMRRNEYDFLQAELCRLEGNVQEAHIRLTKITSMPKKTVKNVSSLAKHRLNYVTRSLSAVHTD